MMDNRLPVNGLLSKKFYKRLEDELLISAH